MTMERVNNFRTSMKNAINTSINTEECIIHFWPSYLHFNLKKKREGEGRGCPES